MNTTKKLKGSFREIADASQIEGLFGDLWAVGMDGDEPKILCHMASYEAGGLGQPFTARQISHLDSGCRLFFYDTRADWPNCEQVADKWGKPTDPFMADRIREAIESFRK